MEATPQGDLHYSCRYEMLSNAKHPLASYTLSTQSLVGFEEILRYTQNDNMGGGTPPAKNTKGDRGVAFSISSRGKLIQNYFCAKNALISSSSKMFCVWKT